MVNQNLNEIEPREYEVELVEVKELYSSVKLFRFKFDKIFSFIPGQFIMLQLIDSEGKTIKRSYSIASSPGGKFIELCMDIIPNGKFTPLLDKLRKGKKLKLLGPYGKFGRDIFKSEKEIVFISTGTGIAPIKSILLFLLKNEFNKKITLISGIRHEERYLFNKEFEDLERKHNNFELIPVLSQPRNAEKWNKEIGRVQDILKKLDINDQEFFICGLIEMVKDVKKFLKDKKVSYENIHTEIFI